MTYYRVHATVIKTRANGWESSLQVPTYFIEAKSAKAAYPRARYVVDPFGEATVSLSIVNKATRTVYLSVICKPDDIPTDDEFIND